MSDPPVVVLAMSPVLCAGLVRPAQLERLRAIATVPDPEPLGQFHEPRAEALLGQAEILLTGWGCSPLDANLLARAPRLRAVVHAAGTVKNHVTEACFERGLAISSAAAANAVPVAEYTLAAILLANKRAFQLSHRYHELRAFRLWAAETPGLGNYRKRIGLVGASRIGRRVLALLAPFDFEVRVSDPTLSDEEQRALGVKCCPLDELLPWCDVLSLHAPLVPSTQGLLDARRLSLLRDGSTLVNTARGGLVDTVALEAELASGRIAAVIDTTEPEVLPADSPLYELPNVFLTPHIAGSMGNETERMVDCALDEIERLARGDALEHGILRADWEQIA
jgi:phosphoglycerate dehydrogenase-like enzyme